MSKPFDATTKLLLDVWPEVCLRLAGWEADGPLEVVDAGVSTLVAEADKVIKVHGSTTWIIHVELQASRDPTLPLRILRYNALLWHRHNAPVRSLVILLRPEADFPGLTGRLQAPWDDASGWHDFGYTVIRLWTLPVESFLDGELGLLPLAILADHPREAAPEILGRIESRLCAADPQTARTLWNATWVLMGLRYPKEFAEKLLRGIEMLDLRESSTYQLAVEEGQKAGLAKGLSDGLKQGRDEGKLEEARGLLLRIGTKKYGAPDPATLERLGRLAETPRIEAIIERILDAQGWPEAFGDLDG